MALLFEKFLPNEKPHLRCLQFLALGVEDQARFWNDLRERVERKRALDRSSSEAFDFLCSQIGEEPPVRETGVEGGSPI